MSLVRKIQARTPSPAIHGQHFWCGPWAVAALARKPYVEAYEACQAVSGRDCVQTMPFWQVTEALERLAPDLRLEEPVRFKGRGLPPGMTPCPGTPADERPTLAAWLRKRDRKSAYLVMITGHFIVVAGDRVIDNQMKVWTSVRASKHRRARVLQTSKVELLNTDGR